ncbi:transcriptional regulator, AraC family [Seinonella peptonophila]|uniref:Transcriptional regulator, AraC family n=1 Tax=Seinonella peptonophila TaxID=112248 RepID=A0A1M5BD16_9BACL|nr:bifunctional transcriptional activator/DNA repair enzyme AdaA [Seinonella peptonophila]SHF40369.1 transcriptional regulator, AraC family [Seinonella peptonophila]
MQTHNPIHKKLWEAIVSNNHSYDGKFFYGVQTTKVFCRPSCPSRIPKLENVRIFYHRQEAINEGFRPCKRCRPDQLQLPIQEWIDQIKRFLEKNWSNTISLDLLANVFHLSPYHLQRTFKKCVGVTPAQYLEQIKVDQAMHYLQETDQTMKEIAQAVGISNAQYFTTIFKKKTGVTPSMYRKSKGGNRVGSAYTTNDLLDNISQ